MSLQATNKALSILPLCQTILSSLSHKEQNRCSLVSSTFRRSVDTLQRTSEVEKLLRNPDLRQAILKFVSPEDLDRSRRIRRSFNHNITEFQRVRLPSLFPQEMRDIVANRATFQVINLDPAEASMFGREDLSTSVVAGYFRGQPFLACKMDWIYGPGYGPSAYVMKDMVSVVYDNRRDYWGFNKGFGSDHAARVIMTEIIHGRTHTPEFAKPPLSRSCCELISDLFRRLCCCPKRRVQVYPQYRLSKEP